MTRACGGGLRIRGVAVLASGMLGCLAWASPALASGGTLSIVAGTGAAGPSTLGQATSSQLAHPVGVAVDAAGNLFIADQENNRVERVSTSGVLSFVAGTGSPGAPTPGAALSSSLHNPQGVAVDPAGDVYIADTFNNVIEKVTPSGVLSIVAGTGSAGAPTPGPATSSALSSPSDVAVDSAGNVYIADSGSYDVLRVAPSGTLSIVAGTGSWGTPVPGPASSSALGHPAALAVDSSGDLYIADSGEHMIEQITPSGTLSIVAGSGSYGAPTPGPATSSALAQPSGVAVDSAGALYIGDTGNNEIEQVTPSGFLSVYAGTTGGGAPTPGPATSTGLGLPFGVAVDSAGNLYIDALSYSEIEKVTPLPAPTNTAAPVVSGAALQGQALTVSHGTWTGGPSGYTVQWQDCDSSGNNCTNIAGATGHSYTPTSSDVGHTLQAVVTATNAGGTASQTSALTGVVAAASAPPAPIATVSTSTTAASPSATTTATTITATPTAAPPVTVTGPACPAASGSLAGLRLGPVALGMTPTQVRQALPTATLTHNGFDRSCLAGQAGKLRVGYPTVGLLSTLTASQRAGLRGRVVLALTANPTYALDKIKPGTRIAAIRRQVARMNRFHVGRNTWYVIRGAQATGVLKVQDATVQEIGIANRALTATDDAQRQLLTSF